MNKSTPAFSHGKNSQQVMSMQQKVDPSMTKKSTRRMDICRRNMTHNH